MRAYTLIVFAVLSQLLSVGYAYVKNDRRQAMRSSAVTRTTATKDTLIASRQHHERRSLLDLCVYIDIDINTDHLLPDNILGIPLSDLLDLKVCLCLSAFPLILETDVQLKALSDKYGASLVQAVIELLVNLLPSSRHCTYPDHSKSICSVDDPCGWTCDPPYVRQGGECVCAPPYSMCNGVCAVHQNGCGSAVPRALIGRTGGYLYPRLTGQAAAQSSCKSYETVCGVYNTASDAYECVDINKALDSCGGCVVPSPFLGSGASSPIGRDCTAIEGVETVACISGSCSVTGCKRGWMFNDTGDSCVRVDARTPAALAFNVAMQAMEHAGLVVRTPDKTKLEPKVGEPKTEGEEEEPHSDFYTNAFYSRR